MDHVHIIAQMKRKNRGAMAILSSLSSGVSPWLLVSLIQAVLGQTLGVPWATQLHQCLRLS